ncbi:uncharacterized protein LOC128984828 [Macrosteles quadrilineatus]|uniref:uncharacterized protein LOC128984828 n=1 Tax=Macrosteles quadrilineatus TaxID=74068 RepID=UPI0023E25B8C|nr:uncharacterized protein LOC128984828 [Macrosteles quadrilineatus]
MYFPMLCGAPEDRVLLRELEPKALGLGSRISNVGYSPGTKVLKEMDVVKATVALIDRHHSDMPATMHVQRVDKILTWVVEYSSYDAFMEASRMKSRKIFTFEIKEPDFGAEYSCIKILANHSQTPQ